jgi:hypothetical protein
LIKTLLIAVSVLLLSLNFIDIDINEQLPYDHKEKFNQNLAYINSTDKLERYIDSNAVAGAVDPRSIEYVDLIVDAIKNRFFHGFSHFSIKENWIAAFSERLIGYGLASKVRPGDILQHPNAACSQQSIVMMDILRRKKISYRNVGFPHHYALEVLVNDKWYYFDPNMEPVLTNTDRLEENWKLSADNLKKFYDTSRFKDLDWKFGKHLTVTKGTINEIQAANAKFFQNATGVISRIAFIFPLLLLYYISKRKQRNRKA